MRRAGALSAAVKSDGAGIGVSRGAKAGGQLLRWRRRRVAVLWPPWGRLDNLAKFGECLALNSFGIGMSWPELEQYIWAQGGAAKSPCVSTRGGRPRRRPACVLALFPMVARCRPKLVGPHVCDFDRACPDSSRLRSRSAPFRRPAAPIWPLPVDVARSNELSECPKAPDVRAVGHAFDRVFGPRSGVSSMCEVGVAFPSEVAPELPKHRPRVCGTVAPGAGVRPNFGHICVCRCWPRHWSAIGPKTPLPHFGSSFVSTTRRLQMARVAESSKHVPNDSIGQFGKKSVSFGQTLAPRLLPTESCRPEPAQIEPALGSLKPLLSNCWATRRQPRSWPGSLWVTSTG